MTTARLRISLFEMNDISLGFCVLFMQGLVMGFLVMGFNVA